MQLSVWIVFCRKKRGLGEGSMQRFGDFDSGNVGMDQMPQTEGKFRVSEMVARVQK